MSTERSPRYPNMSLGEAISRAKAIYEREHMSMMTPAVVAEAMGYKGVNGASLKSISALKRYGLLEGRGDDVRLTKDAQVLIIDSPDSPDYQQAIRRAATAPEVFADIAKQFGATGSERNIAVFLEKQGFKPDAAATVARNYKESLALVSQTQPAYSDDEQPEQSGANVSQAAESRQSNRPRFYGGGEPVSASPQGVSSTGAVGQATVTVGDEATPFRVTLNGRRLDVVASAMDLASVQVLRKMLEQYEQILGALEMVADAKAKQEPKPST